MSATSTGPLAKSALSTSLSLPSGIESRNTGSGEPGSIMVEGVNDMGLLCAMNINHAW